VLACFLLLSFLPACSSSDAELSPPPSPGPTDTSTPTPTGTPIPTPLVSPYTPSPTPTPTPTPTPSLPMGRELFQKECASCHGLPPKTLLMSSGEQAALSAIEGGTRHMKAYGKAAGGNLNPEQIASLVDFLKETPARIPPGPFYPHPEPASPCTSCHNSQQVGSPPETIHAGLSDQTCSTCHLPALLQPGPIPHPAEDTPPCSTCHQEDGTALMPSDHEGRTDDGCASCHTRRQIPPSPPHTTSRTWARCPQCHNPDATITPPPDHEGRDEKTCALTVCHPTSH
ncbi:MAG: c-type cytochrome, partial [Dehalococcoidia bacterium]